LYPLWYAAAGGGLVTVPPGGVYKTGALSLKTNVSLFLPSGSNLLGSSNPDDYTGIAGGNWDNWDVLHSTCSSCGLVGDVGATGTLQGPMWQMIAGFDASEVRCALPKSPQATVAQRSPTLLLQNQLQPVRWTNISGCIGECRPRLLVFEDSGDVSVSNVQLRDSADWTQVT
jgi:polygalacturonase